MAHHLYIAQSSEPGWAICFNTTLAGQEGPCVNEIYGNFDTAKEAYEYLAANEEELQQSATDMEDMLKPLCEGLLQLGKET